MGKPTCIWSSTQLPHKIGKKTKKCIYIYVNYELFISPINCTLYIFPYHLKKKTLSMPTFLLSNQTNHLLMKDQHFFFITFDEKSFEIPNFDNLLFFNFFQMKQIKNWSQNLLKNIMLDVICKCSYDFLKIFLELNYNLWINLKFVYKILGLVIQPWNYFIPCLIVLVFILHMPLSLEKY